MINAFKQFGSWCIDIGTVIVISVLFAGRWLWNKAKLLAKQVNAWHARRKACDENAVHRSRRRKRRFYYYGSGGGRHQKQLNIAFTAFLSFVLIFSLIKLGGYVSDYVSAQRASSELRTAYYEALNEETATPTAVPATPTPVPTPTATPEPDATPAPTATPRTMLETIKYPGNRYANISSRFQKIRRQNSDIVGWLTIPDLIDEAVVQRDNSYYLRRDYRGYHNDNGAIFLEESCDLDTRPYTMMLFGHNMKSGAMFGCLRNYENIYFYRSNPFITFDTAYEDGKYVIFSVGTLNQNSRDRSFVDIKKLSSMNIAWRETAISQLKTISEISTSIDVNADDQLLLLITCVDDDTERRVVAARRIRDDETEESLQNLVKRSRSK